MKRRIVVSAVLSVLLLAALAANVHAAEVKINASDGAASDLFGGSVAISGDYAIVGACGDSDAGSDSGSAYIYTIGIFSCDSDGNPMDQFAPGETVYVTGTNLIASTGYKLWIQDEAVSVGDALDAGEDPSGAQESVDTDTSGTLPVIAIWAIDPGAAVTHTGYDIVADNQAAGVVAHTTCQVTCWILQARLDSLHRFRERICSLPRTRESRSRSQSAATRPTYAGTSAAMVASHLSTRS